MDAPIDFARARELRAGHRVPSRGELIQALRPAADNVHRMIARLRDDQDAKPLLLEIARQLDGMRQTALHAAHQPEPTGPEAA